MINLSKGMMGIGVKNLQNALALAGFAPGKLDGVFGSGTEAALMAFQRSEGLTPDGIAGPATYIALEAPQEGVAVMVPDCATEDVEAVARMVPLAPLHRIQMYLPLIRTALNVRGLDGTTFLKMAVATIAAEVPGFLPIDEGISRYNTSPGGLAFDLYDNRKDLGNRGRPDGNLFKGRGFVQLTGRYNYAAFDQILVMGGRLMEAPDRANEPTTAAAILAAFLQRNERSIRAALRRTPPDLATARRLVNGGSHGLEEFTRAYNVGMRVLP